MGIAITVPGPQVSTNAAYRAGRGGFWMTPDGKDFKSRVAYYAREAMRGRSSLREEVQVSIDFYFPTRRNDIDGPVKLVLDSLQPWCFGNDRQVVTLHVHKHLDPDNPRTLVGVYAV